MKKWTLMVFMAAETDRDWVFADHDIGELEEVGSNEDVAVVVQVHRRPRQFPRRYFIRPAEQGGRMPIRRSQFGENYDDETDLSRVPDATPTDTLVANNGSPPFSDPEVLTNFLNSVIGDPQFQAERYALVLWGHSTGFQYGPQRDPLEVFQLAKVIRNVFLGGRGRKLEILGCDACSMSKAETAYELRDSVDFFIGSQIGIPLYAGWPYNLVMRLLRRNPPAEVLARGIVRAFHRSFEQKAVALSALNLGHASLLKPSLSEVAGALLKEIDNDQELLRTLSAFYCTRRDDYEPLWDFPDLCRNLAERTNSDAVRAAARAALTQLGYDPGGTPNGSRLVLLQRRKPRGEKIRGLNGFGVYVPLFVPQGAPGCAALYERCEYNMALIDGTKWGELVQRLRDSVIAMTTDGKGDESTPKPLSRKRSVVPMPVSTAADESDKPAAKPVIGRTSNVFAMAGEKPMGPTLNSILLSSPARLEMALRSHLLKQGLIEN